MKEKIRESLIKSGAAAVGFARAGEIDKSVHEKFKEWIGKGKHGDMSYLERHIPLRKHTDNVLMGATTVISLAYSYFPKEWRSNELPCISAYAYGEDYHYSIKEKLLPVVKDLQVEFGGKWRICIDSAPLAEKYWALKSGIGKRGLNGSIIVNGCGSMCFLAEILTTLSITPDNPSEEICEKCGECIRICPVKAISGDGTIDASKCINYLTIEKKGEFSEVEKKLLRSEEGYLFGCDRCIRVCRYNRAPSCSNYTEIHDIPEINSLLPCHIINIGEGEFKKIFARSPLSYAGLSRLHRNARNLLEETND